MLGTWTATRVGDVMKRWWWWVASILLRQVKRQVGPNKEDRQSRARLSEPAPA